LWAISLARCGVSLLRRLWRGGVAHSSVGNGKGRLAL
jgi:hypothetical protein